MSRLPSQIRYQPFATACLDLLRLEAADPEASQQFGEIFRSTPSTSNEVKSCLEFLALHRLDQLFLRSVLDHGLETTLPAELLEPLKTARRQRALNVLLQQEAAQQAAAALEKAAIRYIFFKGFHLGEQLYGDAVLRPSADLDILVSEDDQDKAIQELATAGFEKVPQEDGPDYEVTLFGHGTSVDLHWHLIQPQRSRVPLTPPLLAAQKTVDGISFPNDEAGLLVLLLNPAITDHVSDRLIQAVDVDRWVRNRAGTNFDWPWCLELLESSGLATAAWAMLVHARSIFGTPIPGVVEQRLQPSLLRRNYLQIWLRRDPAEIYRRHPLLVRLGFSLWLQDQPRDIFRFLFWYALGKNKSNRSNLAR